MAFFENLTYIETVIDNPSETDPAKVISRTEVCPVPNYLKARCIFFKRFLEEKKNDGQDLNYESFYMGLTLDEFMEWKATEMTMNPQPSMFHGGHKVVPAVKLKMIPYEPIGGSPLQENDLRTPMMHAFSDELDSALYCNTFSTVSGSVATMTTQGFDNHGVEEDFYSLMPSNGESLQGYSYNLPRPTSTFLKMTSIPCDCSSRHSTTNICIQDHGEHFTSDTNSRLQTMVSICMDPRISTHSTSVDVSVLPHDRGPNSILIGLLKTAIMPLCSVLYAPSSHEILPLAAQDHGEISTDQKRFGRINLMFQAFASATVAADDQGNDERADSSIILGSEYDSSLVVMRDDSVSSTRQSEYWQQLPRVRCNLFHTDGITFSFSDSVKHEDCFSSVQVMIVPKLKVLGYVCSDDTDTSQDVYTRNLGIHHKRDTLRYKGVSTTIRVGFESIPRDPSSVGVLPNIEKECLPMMEGDYTSEQGFTREGNACQPLIHGMLRPFVATFDMTLDLIGIKVSCIETLPALCNKFPLLLNTDAYGTGSKPKGALLCDAIDQAANAMSSRVLLPTRYATSGLIEHVPSKDLIDPISVIAIDDTEMRSADSTKENVKSSSSSFVAGAGDVVNCVSPTVKNADKVYGNELMESSGNTSHPFSSVTNHADCFEDATIEDDDEGISCSFPDLVEFVLGLQSDFERSIAEVLTDGELITLPDSAYYAVHSELVPSSDLPSPSGAEKLSSATARAQLDGFPKTFDIDNDCIIVTTPDMNSFINEFSCENADNLSSLMGSVVIGEHFHSDCLQLKAPSDSDATVLPFDRGPSNLLTTSDGSLRSLPFDRGPCLSSAALRVIPGLFFQISEVPDSRDECISRLFTQGELKVLNDGASQSYGTLLPLPTIIKGMCFFLCDLICCGKDFTLMGSDRNHTALHACAFILVTRRSVAAILHFLNQTPIDWYSKKQATVETATFGSEFIAARTTIDQVIDLQTTLRYLRIPIRKRGYIFGDNKAVIDSSSTPHAKLHKGHNALSFHRVREAVASKCVLIFHLPGEYNPADILSKHWAYASVWQTMNALLFTRGDTWDLLDYKCEEE
jgi:hypothetical protein